MQLAVETVEAVSPAASDRSMFRPSTAYEQWPFYPVLLPLWRCHLCVRAASLHCRASLCQTAAAARVRLRKPPAFCTTSTVLQVGRKEGAGARQLVRRPQSTASADALQTLTTGGAACCEADRQSGKVKIDEGACNTRC